MFVNLTHHPWAGWSAEQKAACEATATPICDLVFPVVSPEASEEDVAAIAVSLAGKTVALGASAALVEGEFTLLWRLVYELRNQGIACYSATSARGTPFQFVRLREYR